MKPNEEMHKLQHVSRKQGNGRGSVRQKDAPNHVTYAAVPVRNRVNSAAVNKNSRKNYARLTVKYAGNATS